MVDQDQPNNDQDFCEIVDPHKRTFLQAYARSGRIGYACKAAGVSPMTSWNWRHAVVDEDSIAFNAAFARAVKASLERAEGELWRRGLDGYEKPVFHKGKVVGTVREFDTTAAIFMMKGNMPDKYRENVHYTGAALPGSTIDVSVHVRNDQGLEDRLKQLVDMLHAPHLLPAQSSPPAIDVAPVSTPEERAYQDALKARQSQQLRAPTRCDSDDDPT